MTLESLFLRILNLSFGAGVLVLVVLLLRLLLKNAPKRLRCWLWALVALRLLCPVSLASPLSLFELLGADTDAGGNAAYFHQGGGSEKPLVSFDVYRIEEPSADRTTLLPLPGTELAVTEHRASRFLPPLIGVWLAGAGIMLLYALISWVRLRRQVAASLPLRDNILLSDALDEAFVFGLVRPRIYLPSALSEPQLSLVLAHERAHLSRRDHWWKALGFGLLAVYWFNPLLWLSYVLLCRDMELACDERVVRDMESRQRADYAEALLHLSRGPSAACPLAFGEIGVKERIKAALRYKKPPSWLVRLAVAVILLAAVCFLTGPVVIKNPWTQEYVPGEGNIVGQVDTERFESVSPDFAIGATKEGVAVFKEPRRAFRTLKKLYAADIRLIAREFHLPPLTHLTYKLYDTYGWQAEGATEGCLFVSSCLGIYENSFLDAMDLLYISTAPPRNLPPALDAAVHAAVLEHNRGRYRTGDCQAEGHITLAVEGGTDPAEMGDDNVALYLMALYQEYVYTEEGFHAVGGAHLPTVLTFRANAAQDGYELVEYWEPSSGADYWAEVREKYPYYLFDVDLDPENRLIYKQQACYAQAVAYGRVDTEAVIGGLFDRFLATLEEGGRQGEAPHGKLYSVYSGEQQSEEMRELIYYGEYTLRYIIRRFLEGGQTDFRGQVMLLIMNDLAEYGPVYREDLPAQECFDEWLRQADELEQEKGREWMKKNRPAASLALRMQEEGTALTS